MAGKDETVTGNLPKMTGAESSPATTSNGNGDARPTKGTRDLLLIGGKPKMRLVSFPELDNAEYMVRAMTTYEQDWLADQTRTEIEMDKQLAHLKSESARAQITCWVLLDRDPPHRRIFSDEDVEDVKDMDAAIVMRVFGVSNTLSRVKDAEIDKIVEGFTKTPGGNSSTTSR